MIRSLEGLQALSGLTSTPVQIQQPVLVRVPVEKLAQSMIGPVTFVLGQHQRFIKNRVSMELHRQQFLESLPTILATSKQNGIHLSISKQQIAELSDNEWAELFSVANTLIESNNGKLSLSHAFNMAQQIRGGDFDIWRYGGIFVGILAYLMNGAAFTSQSGPVRDPRGRIDVRWDGTHRRKPAGSSERSSNQLVVKPDYLEQEKFSNLTAGQKRAIPDPYDEFAMLPNGVIVRVGFHQMKDKKVKPHGAATGLPFEISASGGTKTEKTDRNALAAMSVVAHAARSSEIDNPNAASQLYEGTYQLPPGQVPENYENQRGFEAYLVYEPEINRISVYDQATNDFVTVCIMTDQEVMDFTLTGNFGGEAGWFSAKPKNLPPSDALKSKIQELSPINFKAIDEKLSQGKDTSIDMNNKPEL